MGTTREDVRVDDVATGPAQQDTGDRHGPVPFGQPELRAWTDGVLHRHPAVGLAVGVVRGPLQLFEARGFADVASRTRVGASTVFRIGSLTKPFTAVAVMQLQEQGLIDLDAPADAYLRAYALIPSHPGRRPVTVRHLLTHTAGIAEVQHLRDLFHPEAGPIGGRPVVLSVGRGEPLPSLAEHYRRGLPVVAEPGTVFAYSNHGFATLGQIVEDVSGVPLERYLRERIFEPLGMEHTDLVRSDRVAPRLATGYTVGRHGVAPVPDRDWIGAGAGGIYSTVADVARFVPVLTRDGAGPGGVLGPAALAAMLQPHHRPDRRLPGWGLGVARADAGGHPVVGHDGILPGFNSALVVAPDDGLGVVALTNGSPGAFGWMAAECMGLIRHLLDVPDEGVRTDVPQHPEVWAGLCGRYRLPPRVSDLRGRLAIPGGVEVVVRRGRLMLRASTASRALYRGAPLLPDDPDDPYAFRLDLSGAGLGAVRVVFGRDQAGAAALHADLGGQPLSLVRTRPRQARVRGTSGPGGGAPGGVLADGEAAR